MSAYPAELRSGLPGSLITLSGIDGTGKSTLARHIQEYLSDRFAIRSRYLWCKFGDYPLSRYRPHLPIRRTSNAPSRAPAAAAATARPSVPFKLYGQVMLAFHLAQIAIAVRAPLRRGQAVICDRYIYDTMIDLKQELGYSMERAQAILSAPWIPRPDFRFLLDISEQAAFQRKPDSRSVEFLAERRSMYRELATRYSLTVIDTSQSLERVAQLVCERISAEDIAKGCAR